MKNQSIAIPFILRNQHNDYQITQLAQKFLSTINQPFSIITTAGLYRTGKSYLLNRVILDRSKGFNVGPTVNPCTKGLWIWNQLLLGPNNKHYLVIDTQGLGALDQQANHDMKIICLAVLLSTTFIYNSTGSIDENALQTLSLVLNLVNSIDHEQISMRPQFIWVVRDFALQLINEQGESITSKQYLQLALSTTSKQPQKIQIRSIITSAFSQRDCFTLVKPLIDQTKLQDLDKIPLDELRSEFISQSMQLRKRILSTLKPIRLQSNGDSNLKGKDYLRMAQKYVQAINHGKVPDLKDAWTYIKQQKARQALQQVKKSFTQRIKSRISNKIPLKHEQLKEIIESISLQIIQQYKQITYENSQIEQLNQFLKNNKNNIFKINTQQTKLLLTTFLNKQFQPFQKKLHSNYYQNFSQFKEELKQQFKTGFLEKYLDKIDMVEESLQNFIKDKSIQSFVLFEKVSEEKIKQFIQIRQQIQKKHENELTVLKQSSQQENKRLRTELYKLQREVTKLSSENKLLQDTRNNDKVSNSQKLESIYKKNQEMEQIVKKINTQLQEKNLQFAERERQLFLFQKQYEKERALFKQRQQYLISEQQQNQKKNEKLKAQLKQLQQSIQQNKKALSTTMQTKIHELIKENQLITQKCYQYQNREQTYLDKISTVNSDLQKANKKCLDIQRKYKSQYQQAEEGHIYEQRLKQIQSTNRKLQQDYSSIQKTLKSTEIVNKELNDQIKNLKISNEKQIAIHTQKIQFQEIQINELRIRYQEIKKSYQSTLENMQDTNKSAQQNLQIKIYEIQAENDSMLKNIENQNDEKIKLVKKELQQAIKQKEHLQLQLTLERKNAQSKQKEWKQTTSKLQDLYTKTQQKLLSSEKGYEDLYKEKQCYFKTRIKHLQQEVQDIKQKTSQQLFESQKKSEETLAELKKYSELERSQFQRRITNEKEKCEKKIKNIMEEMDQKHTQQKQSLEEQITQLQQKMHQINKVYHEKVQNMQYDHDITLQKTVNQFMDEKVQLNKQIAVLTLTKQNLTTKLEQQRKHFEEKMSSYRKGIQLQHSQALARLTEQKDKLQQKYKLLKKSNQQTEQSNLLLKTEQQKQKAVYKQKQIHHEKKIRDLQNSLQSELISYNQTIQRINQSNLRERNNLNKEIEKLKEMNFKLVEEKNLLVNDYQSQVNILSARNNQLSMHLQRKKNDYEDTINKFKTTVDFYSSLLNDKKNENEANCNNTIMAAKQQCQNQISVQRQRNAKIIKQYQNKIAKMRNQNKQLKDKLILQQVQPNINFAASKEVQRLTEKYEQRINEYKKIIDSYRLKIQELQRRLNLQKSYITDKSDRSSIGDPSIGASRYLHSQCKTSTNTKKFVNQPLINKKSSGRVIQNQDFSGIRRYKQ